MTARDIIDDAIEDGIYQSDRRLADYVLDVLREAAGASEGDTITIGPDGTVGRLEKVEGYAMVDSIPVAVYHVVTP